ncbi:T9SS type A sorting domain-containing protein [Flavobacterium sp. 102]|uniref:T9SS type A sorting domain-containing protein n=1 Tax=Flavobacterium sp. 102 TaxID=2135623 RepID=UPI000EABA694|nr:T9SS type A sorting domain-containing protein [Flavobacterium sp. 102]RKS02477.1 putative secreted protein (Por secretion system target) [Flavobacterium sp. 102]
MGATPVTWVSTIDVQVRFYTHADDNSPVTANSIYYVIVSGYDVDEVGTFCLKVSRNQLLSNEDFNDSNFTYYPNPVKNILNLSYSQEVSGVEIYNLLGQRVSVNSVNVNQAQIDMSNLPSAAYVVKVTANNQVKTVRVIKE